MLFHRLTLEAFCHATEDPKKVKEALLSFVPFDVTEKDTSQDKLEGSFGNDIIVYRISFDKQPEINKTIDFVKSSISQEQMENFYVDEHVTDDDNFWVRFDKQAAVGGKVSLGGKDTIQLKGKVAAFPAKREKAVQMMEDFWRV